MGAELNFRSYLSFFRFSSRTMMLGFLKSKLGRAFVVRYHGSTTRAESGRYVLCHGRKGGRGWKKCVRVRLMDR
jgi:hypothetical protein